MKKILLMTYLIIFPLLSFSQTNNDNKEKDNVSLNLLNAPNEPAFILMDIEETSIERPTNPNKLLISLKKATNNFSVIPESYGLSFAPALLGWSKYFDYKAFINNDGWQNFAQNSIISIGTTSISKNDSIISRKLSIGFKLAILRGDINTETKEFKEKYYAFKKEGDRIQNETNKKINMILDSDSLYHYHNEKVSTLTENISKLNKSINDLEKKIEDLKQKNNSFESDEQSLSKNKEELETLMTQFVDSKQQRNERKIQIELNVNSEYNEKYKIQLEKLKTDIKNLEYKRIGFFIDLAGGAVWNFPENKFDNGELYKGAAWINFGWNNSIPIIEISGPFSIIGMGRYSGLRKEEYKIKIANTDKDTIKIGNNSYWDLGFKITWDLSKNCTFSGEGINRIPVNNPDLKSEWKVIFNFDYQIQDNVLLTIGLGKGYDKLNQYKTKMNIGDMTAGINLSFGLGSEKNL